jgi:hypothetical protein
MWSLYVPAENLFLLKKHARFCDGCAGRKKGSLPYKKQVYTILTMVLLAENMLRGTVNEVKLYQTAQNL